MGMDIEPNAIDRVIVCYFGFFSISSSTLTVSEMSLNYHIDRPNDSKETFSPRNSVFWFTGWLELSVVC